MKFKVTRTSNFNEKKQPCEGVKLEKYDYIERIFCDDEEFFDRNYANSEGLWRSKGINHTTFCSGIQRTLPNDREGWFIGLNSLEELIEFIKKVDNKIVIQECYDNETIYEIEIYDDYRE